MTHQPADRDVMQGEALLPCPYCANPTSEDWGETTIGGFRRWRFCPECNATGPQILSRRGQNFDEVQARADEAWNDRALSTPPIAPSAVQDIVTCCVTGAIPGDGGACGDCDPCITGEASVPAAVKRLIAEKNSLLDRICELEEAASVIAPSGEREAVARVIHDEQFGEGRYDLIKQNVMASFPDVKWPLDSFAPYFRAADRILALRPTPAGRAAIVEAAREVTAPEIARVLCLVDGRDPDDEAPRTEMTDAANMAVPWLLVYMEYAEAVLEKFKVRALSGEG